MKFRWQKLDYTEAAPGEEERFGFECPKQAGYMCDGLLIRGKGNDAPNRTWIWNGNREKPTFQPSIDCKGCSHGFITDGEWRDA